MVNWSASRAIGKWNHAHSYVRTYVRTHIIQLVNNTRQERTASSPAITTCQGIQGWSGNDILTQCENVLWCTLYWTAKTQWHGQQPDDQLPRDRRESNWYRYIRGMYTGIEHVRSCKILCMCIMIRQNKFIIPCTNHPLYSKRVRDLFYVCKTGNPCDA